MASMAYLRSCPGRSLTKVICDSYFVPSVLGRISSKSAHMDFTI